MTFMLASKAISRPNGSRKIVLLTEDSGNDLAIIEVLLTNPSPNPEGTYWEDADSFDSASLKLSDKPFEDLRTAIRAEDIFVFLTLAGGAVVGHAVAMPMTMKADISGGATARAPSRVVVPASGSDTRTARQKEDKHREHPIVALEFLGWDDILSKYVPVMPHAPDARLLAEEIRSLGTISAKVHEVLRPKLAVFHGLLEKARQRVHL